VITPICPHALSNRAIVIDHTRGIRLILAEQRGSFQVSVDGRSITRIDSAATVDIRRAEAELPLILFKETSFYKVLHRKLGWFGSAVMNSREEKE
jgi:NAD+ kinase